MASVPELPGAPLEGEELLTKYNELKIEGKSFKEIAIATGYVRGGRGGQTGNIMALQKALLIVLEPKTTTTKAAKAPRKPRGGRIANYRIQVQQNGNLLIGGAYTRRMGFQPGAEFEIQLGRKHIKLVYQGEGELELEDEE
jgi:hypothetical protein